MGITVIHAHLLIQEHLRKKLPKTVHMLGRQTVFFDTKQALSLFESYNIKVEASHFELDTGTRTAIDRQADYIDDKSFFSALGVENLVAIDVSDYEGADVIVDLNENLPAELASSVEFLYGGSVLDNIFDGAQYIINTSQLLQPGGRFFDQNIISAETHPYLLVTPSWLLDFYLVNNFSNISIYLCHYGGSTAHVYGVQPYKTTFMSDFGPGDTIGLVSIVEKGKHSSNANIPVQDQYRSEEQIAEFSESVARVSETVSYPRLYEPNYQDLNRLPVRFSRDFEYLGVIPYFDSNRDRYTGSVPDHIKTGIQIVEASYGKNLLGRAPEHAGICSGFVGNVTSKLGSLANGLDEFVWEVDVQWLGDWAPQRAKDLEVLFYYSDEEEPKLRRIYIPAEAHGCKLEILRN